MLSFTEANNLVSKKYRNSVVTQTLDAGSFFVVSLEPKDLKDGDISMDGFFAINKETGSISEYSPVKDPEEFKKALQHVVYSHHIQ